MTTTTSTTEAIAHGIHVLSINHQHDYTKNYTNNMHHKRQPDYYSDDDQTSEVTVTTIKDSIKQSPTTTVTNQDWLDEIEHSFDNNSTYQHNDNSTYQHNDNSTYQQNNDSIYQHSDMNDMDNENDHQSIIQSYLEPSSISMTTLVSPPVPHMIKNKKLPVHVSKFSLMKSRMKRVFGISFCHNSENLPVISTNERWAPSIDSACSSTITSAATIRDNMSSNSSIKNYNRHSCGLSTASFKCNSKPTTTQQQQQQQNKKSILKKQQQQSVFQQHPHHNHHKSKSRNSDIDQKRKRWSRMSIMAKPSTSNTKNRLSMIMLKRKKSNSSREMFTNKVVSEKEEGRKGIRFNKYVHVHETWSKGEYDRSSDPEAICTRLTSTIAQQIKQELNHFKLHEMLVHDSSRIHTHFFL